MDGAPIPTIEMAQNKAYTGSVGRLYARLFNFIQGDPVAFSWHPDAARMAAWGGGFPIKVEGEIVGRSV